MYVSSVISCYWFSVTNICNWATLITAEFHENRAYDTDVRGWIRWARRTGIQFVKTGWKMNCAPCYFLSEHGLAIHKPALTSTYMAFHSSFHPFHFTYLLISSNRQSILPAFDTVFHSYFILSSILRVFQSFYITSVLLPPMKHSSLTYFLPFSIHSTVLYIFQS